MEIRSRLLSAALLVIVVGGAQQAGPLLIPLLVAGLLAAMVAPLVRRFRLIGLPEGVAVAGAVLFLVLPLVVGVALVVRQGQSLVADAPSIIASIQARVLELASSPLGVRMRVEEYLDESRLLSRFSSSAGAGLALLIGGATALLGAGSWIALVLVFSVLILGARDHLARSAARILDRSRHVSGPVLVEEVGILVQRFLVARLVISLVVGVVASIVLAAFGLRYGVLMGILVGLMTNVPAVGFFLSLIPPVLMSLATGHGALGTVGMVAALIPLSLLENYWLTPRLVGHTLNVNALATIVGMFAGGLLWGMPGVLLSVPMIAVLRIVLSVSDDTRAWGELLAAREDQALSARLARRVTGARPITRRSHDRAA